MKSYRVLLKENFYEADDSVADHWTEDAGAAAISIVSNKYRFADGTGATLSRAHFTRLVGQAQAMEYQFQAVQYTPNCAPGWDFRMYFYIDNTAGAHYGNGYVVKVIEAAGVIYIKIYKIAANVLTEKASASITFVQGTTYLFRIEYDPATGKIEVFQAGVTKVNWTDPAPLAGGSYVALRANLVDVEYNKVRARRPADSPPLITEPHICHMINQPSTWKAQFKLDSGAAGATEWLVNDGFELELYDSITDAYLEEFDGRVNDVKVDTHRGVAELTGTDWRGQCLKTEAVYAGGAKIVSDIMKDIIHDNLTVLREGSVKASTDAPAARVLGGQYVQDKLYQLCIEAKFSMWQTFWRAFMITDVYPASGVTINDATDDVIDSEWVQEGGEMINQLSLYYGAAFTPTSSYDGGSQALYDKTGKVVVDPTIPDAAHAALYIAGLMSKTLGNEKMIDIWEATYPQLQIGDQVTLTLATLGLAAANGIVIEKEHGPDVPGMRFRVILMTNWTKEKATYHSKVAEAGSRGQGALAFQI